MFGKQRKRWRRRHAHRCHRKIGGEHGRTMLGDLEPGERARIIRVGGHGRSRRRFLEMGLVSGETVLVERVAPLGDPVEFLVKGYHVSLRRGDAQHIEVQILRDDEGVQRKGSY